MTIHEKLPTIQLTSEWLQRRQAADHYGPRPWLNDSTGVMCARARLPAVSLLTFRVFRLFRLRRLIRRFAFIVIHVFRLFRMFRHLLVKAFSHAFGIYRHRTLMQ